MKPYFLFIASLALLASCSGPNENNNYLPVSVFETSQGDSCATYHQTIEFWEAMDASGESVAMYEMGESDAGYPIHLVIVNEGKALTPAELATTDKTVLFINNGIHPGEPDGIEACKLLAKRMLQGEVDAENVVLAMVPVYNIGGMLQRNNYTRANQNGPAEYGFRGNAQNLDLNRDCIKMDSKNAFALAQIFATIDPDFFYDTHVSNGANYQHVVTLLTTQEQKLGGPLEEFYKNQMTPALYTSMQADDYPMIPYVNVWGRSPNDGGIDQFFDSPRYTNGYSTLHHTPSYTIETHMLKPYAQRVDGTLKLLENTVAYLNENGGKLQQLREEQKEYYAQLKKFPVTWKQAREKADSVEYLGYEVSYPESKVTGVPRMFYDTTAPIRKTIPYRCYYTPEKVVLKPNYYLIKQGFYQVAERLKANDVQVKEIMKDTVIEVHAYSLDTVITARKVFEKHYLNTLKYATTQTLQIKFSKGDFLVATGTDKDRLIVETLEPMAHDSYFTWNFFDAVLQQKEGFSPYVWEDKAWELLNQNPELKLAFEQAKKDNYDLATSPYLQLNWIYQHSGSNEPNYLLYPVFRVM